MEPKFLNIDLDILSPSSPQALLTAWKGQVVVLHSAQVGEAGSYESCIELGENYETALDTLIAFDRLLQKLPPAAQADWQGAEKRIFDVGYEMKTASYYTRFDVGKELFEIAERHRAILRFTVYHFKEDKS